VRLDSHRLTFRVERGPGNRRYIACVQAPDRCRTRRAVSPSLPTLAVWRSSVGRHLLDFVLVDWDGDCWWSGVAGVVVAAVGFEPFDGGVGVDLDGPFAFVDETVVEVAEHRRSGDVGFASEFPPVHVVGFGGGRGSGAAGVSAASVAVFEGSSLVFGEGTRRAVHVEGD
jgi:hypothetical protein